MGSKLKWIIPAVVLILIVLVYVFPTPNEPFDAFSGGLPEDQVAAYNRFRNQHRTHRLLTDGASWEYIIAGPQKETVLLLHGLTGAYDIWWQQIVTLRQDFRVIAVTYPAVGSLEELSQGVIRIMDSQNVMTANVVGTSLGGYLAQYLVATHPDRFARVVFSNTFPPNDLIREDFAPLGAAMPFLPEWVIMQGLRGSIADMIFPASGGDEFTRAYLLSLVSGRLTKAQVMARYQTVIEPFTPIEPLDWGIPVMIIESDNDPLVEPALREQLKETYPFSYQVTLEDAGHFPYLNRAEEYSNLLIKFFSTPIMK